MPTRTLFTLLGACCLGACSAWAPPEAQLAQDLRVLAPRAPGATWFMDVEEGGRSKGWVRFHEVGRRPEAGGFRLLLARSFHDEAKPEDADRAELSQLFAPSGLDMRRGTEAAGDLELQVQGPVRLGARPGPREREASLVAIQALELPHGRIPWAAAFERREAGPEGDRVATAWFAPGLGLVRFDEAKPGRPPMSAKLTRFVLP